MLFDYSRRVQKLIRDTRSQIINPSDIFEYINEARNQIAGEAECIRYIGTLTLSAGTNVYPFSSIVLTGGTAAGIQGVLNVRQAWYGVASGQRWFHPRPFEWFALYELNNPVPTTGPPNVWAQFAQGVNGSLYVSPYPDTTYTVPLDCVCYPVPLTTDTTVEAIPLLWTYAVPYYATYLAMMSMETGENTQNSERMFAKYKEYVQRARVAATPSVMPTIYSQVPSPVRANQLGEAQRGGPR
jgi:hypothetical protein